MIEFTTVGGSLATIKPSSIAYFREGNSLHEGKQYVCVFFSHSIERVDLDISYRDFKGRLEDHERREYYNMEATRKL